MTLAIVDYGLGNLRSVEKAFAHLGVEARRIESPAEVEAAGALVLPGVGAFGDGMAGLRERKLDAPLCAAARAGKPILGICLGLQLFFETSEESPGVEGLGLLAGKVRIFQGAAFGAGEGLKVPHMGWNRLHFPRPHPLFQGLDEGAYVYFVHSYFADPADGDAALAWSEYGGRFCAAAGQDRILGCQFHPEKSQTVGLRILKNFLGLAKA